MKLKKTLRFNFILIIVIMAFLMPFVIFAGTESERDLLNDEIKKVESDLETLKDATSKEEVLKDENLIGEFVLTSEKNSLIKVLNQAKEIYGETYDIKKDYNKAKSDLSNAFEELKKTKFIVVSFTIKKEEIPFINNINEIKKTYLKGSTINLEFKQNDDNIPTAYKIGNIPKELSDKSFKIEKNETLTILKVEISELKDLVSSIEKDLEEKYTSKKYNINDQELKTFKEKIKNAKTYLKKNETTENEYHEELLNLEDARASFVNSIVIKNENTKKSLSKPTIAAIVVILILILTPTAIMITKKVRDEKDKKKENKNKN